MNKSILMTLTLSTLGFSCAPAREVVQIVNGKDGKDGTSCSVSSVVEGEETLGALVTCTDGSSALIANGRDGAQGVAGIDGEDGEDGADGVAGQNGGSCSAVRNSGANYVTISCPGSDPVVVYDGVNGTDGKDGTNATGCTLTLAAGPGQDKYTLTCGSTSILINNSQNNGK